ncbi:MAG: hypothetical protein H8E44_01990 [Planctomycetes bacterium]|nr:hypothetical protein [Planctomycetota bacterium]MBL7042162.1 hypothetical protein [Pirellulaceae bacterium]
MNLRSELRAYGRGKVAAFLLAAILLNLSIKAVGMCRVGFTSAFGETAFVWVFGVGMFVVFLVPVIVAEHLLQKNRRLYCPQCGQFLAGFRSMLRINKHDECSCCRTKLNVKKPTRYQLAFDMTLIFGSLALLALFFALVR